MLHSILSSLPILYEEGEEGDPQLHIPDAEGTQETKAEDTTAVVDQKLEVDPLPNGDHVPESTVKPGEPSVMEPAMDAPSTMQPLVDVHEHIQPFPTDSPSISSDVSRDISTPSPDISTVGSDRTALDGEPLVVKSPAFAENDVTLVDEPITKVESEETKLPPISTSTPPSEPEPELEDPWPDTPGQPAKARMSLSSLLRQADDLLARFPPSHSKLDLEKIMGPRSVIFSWTESFLSLPPDDELEQYVKTPQLVVLPYVDPVEEAATKERELKMRKVARRGKLKKIIFSRANAQKKTVFVGAVFALGIAMAVYGIRAPGDAGRGHHKADLKKLLRYIGGLLLAGGDKFVGRLFGH